MISGLCLLFCLDFCGFIVWVCLNPILGRESGGLARGVSVRSSSFRRSSSLAVSGVVMGQLLAECADPATSSRHRWRGCRSVRSARAGRLCSW